MNIVTNLLTGRKSPGQCMVRIKQTAVADAIIDHLRLLPWLLPQDNTSSREQKSCLKSGSPLLQMTKPVISGQSTGKCSNLKRGVSAAC